jgi:hypothetical protein
MLDALSVYHEMTCRGVANVIGRGDERQTPIGSRRLNGPALLCGPALPVGCSFTSICAGGTRRP